MEPMALRTFKHFSMLREFHLADVLTLGNAACGVAAVFFQHVVYGQSFNTIFSNGHGDDAGGIALRLARRSRRTVAA